MERGETYLQEMVIIEDTRNQIGKHKLLNERMQMLGINVIRSKLYVGDYSRLDNQTICIDTKKDWLEVASNLTKQHERFKTECVRAKSAGIKLIILVEQDIDCCEWKSPRRKDGSVISQVKGEVLQKAINTMAERYGVEFIHCDKSATANKIIEILGGTNESKND